MRFSIFYRFAIVFFVLCALFAAPSRAQAKTFSLPPQFVHEGLKFSPQSLFDRPLNVPTGYMKIAFLTAPKVTLSPSITQSPQKIEALVVSPIQEKQFTEVIPTPTMFVSPITGLPSPSPLTTIAPSPSVTPSPAPTRIPTPKAEPTAMPTPAPATPVSNTNPGGLNADKLFTMANAYRAQKGLPSLTKDDRSCNLAASRAPEINAEVAEGHMHSGLRARNLPYWNTENIITMNSEEAAFNWWINDTIHREAIEGNYTYSCVACSGNACAQEFTNFQPK